MTHFPLKSTAIVATFLAVSINLATFAAPIKIECSADPLFAANTCDVCYTEKQTPVKTSTGWTADLSNVSIPFDHSGIELQEVILESSQQLPEIIASTDVKVTPSEPEKIWEFHTDIVWYKVGPDREYFIEKGDKKILYTLQTGVKLALSGKGNKDTVLIKSPLVYEEYDKVLNQSAGEKDRTICVLNTLYTGTTTPPASTPPVVAPVVTPPLDAAGPAAEDEEDETVVPEITPEQTEAKAGPEIWIFLLLAFAFSGAWTAWKKQKA